MQSVKICRRWSKRNGQIMTFSPCFPAATVQEPMVISGSLFRFFRHFRCKKGHCWPVMIEGQSASDAVEIPYNSVILLTAEAYSARLLP